MYTIAARIAVRYHRAALSLMLGFTALGGTAYAQLTVAPQTDLQELARAISGRGVQISAPVIDCHPLGYGEFNYTGSNLGGIQEGVLLTTGTIANAVGPNNVTNRTFEQGTPGNSLLNTVTGRTTFDACRFEFDIIPGGDTLRFNFSFGSEEYHEWVGSQYNDVFGFFISGPGIIGDPGIGAEKNIALLPNSNLPVTINNVNNGSNTAYFHDNTGGPQLQYDGLTRGLQAMAVVQPCQTYRLKLIVADASDRKFDSGVFIERIQSNAVTLEAFTPSGFPKIVEGCNPGVVRFTRETVTPDALDVPSFLGGTAINGVDYPLIGDPDLALARIATIPAGQASVDVLFNAFADGLPEGMENIRVFLGSSICPGFHLDSLDLFIVDSLQATISPSVSICPGGSTTLEASGGINYAWSPATGLDNSTSANPSASPASTTSYQVVVSAGSCTATAATTVTVGQPQLAANILSPLCQGGTNGAINLSVSGGTAPYTFAWSGPGGFNASSEDLVNVGMGTYTVIVTDANGCSRTQSFNVIAPTALQVDTQPGILPFGENISCHGGQDGSITLTVTGGTAPYAHAWTGPAGFTSNAPQLTGLAAGTYQVTVTDANGCSVTATRTLVQPTPLTASVANVIHNTCFGASDGAATVIPSGGIPPYSFAWNTTPAQLTATANDLPSGTWTCTVTDGYGCLSTVSVAINGPAAPLAVSLTNISDVFQCQGQQNPHGTATAVITGGQAPYTTLWNTVPPQSGTVGNFNAGGTYTVTVTDANGCTASTSVNVQQPGSPSITVVQQQHVICHGDGQGSATVALSGGSAIQSITWNTVPPQTGTTATGLPAGTWTATAQHADGCQTIASVTINGPASPLAVNITGTTHVGCHGDGAGSATATAAGGVGPYTYTWNTTPVQSGPTATGLAPGTHTVTVTDANGCSAQAQATVTGPTAPLAVSITGYTNVLCHGNAQGTAQALATGGTQPYQYSWNSVPVQNGAAADDLPEGPLVVTVTDANGCTATATVNIGGPQFGISAFFEQVTHVSCYGANDGSATIEVSGGSNSFTIIWPTVPPQFGPTATGLAPGLYTVEVQDNNGCDTPKFYDVTILGPAAPLAVNIIATDPTCSYYEDGTLAASISGGEAPYNLQWSDQYGNTAGVPSLSGLEGGTYGLYVWDANGCSLDTSVVLTPPPPISIQGTITTASCQGSPTGSISTSQTGAVQPFSIFWTGPGGFAANTFTIGGLAAGVYTMYITDGNGCAGMQAFDVSEPGAFTVDAVVSSHAGGWNLSCASAQDGSISASASGGTGGLTFTWTGPNGFTASGAAISGLGAGTYHLTVTDESGCSVLSSYTLTAPPSLVAEVSTPLQGGHHISCHGAADGTINTSVSGGTAPYTYAWNGPNGFTSAAPQLSGLEPGTYTLTVTDANGCVRTVQRTLTEPAPLGASVITSTSASGDAIGCHGASTGSIDMSIMGGVPPYAVTWSGPNGFASSAIDLFNLVAGTYTASITDGNGCSTGLSVSLTQPQPIDLQLEAISYNGQALSCAGAQDGGITASVNGGAGTPALSWSGPNGFVAQGNVLQDLQPGTYMVIATDDNGCSATASLTLTAPEPLAATPTLSDWNGQGISCHGLADGSISLALGGGTAPFTVLWSGPDGFTANGAMIEDLVAGDYGASITDANGCVLELDFTLTAPQPLGIDLLATTFPGGTNISCSGAADGGVDMTISGGTAPYTINWTDGLGFTASTEDIANVGAGAYQVTVVDANGCEAQSVIVLTAPQPLGITATPILTNGNHITCAGASDGHVNVTVSGGMAPYVHAWSHGASTADLLNAPAGIYQLTVTDAHGCVAQLEVELTEPESMSVELSAAVMPGGFGVSCHDADDGSASSVVLGGTAPYVHAWSGPLGFSAQGDAIADLAAGDYTLTVTDANGCTTQDSITITAPAPVAVSLNANTWNGGVHTTCAGASDGQLGATVTGGSPGYQLLWSGPEGFTATTASINGLSAGTYLLTAIDANGCVGSASMTLDAPAPMDLDILTSDAGAGYQVSCDGNDGSIQVAATGGTPAYQFAWTGPDGYGHIGAAPQGLAPGTYVVVATDANGCTFTASVDLEAPAPLVLAINTTPNTCPGDATGVLEASTSGGVSPVQFSWTGPDGFTATDATITGLAAGTYVLQASDDLGCAASSSIELIGPAPLASGTYVSFYGLFNLQCAGDSTGLIELQPQGGTAPYAVQVTSAGGYAAAGTLHAGLAAGAYTVSIVDAQGCAMDTLVTLTQPDTDINATLDVSLFPSGTNVSCHGASDGWINATVTGGSGPYTFTWRPDSLEFDTPFIGGLPAGDYAYELVVIDANQCSFTVEVTLTQPDAPLEATLTAGQFGDGLGVSCNEATDGSIGVEATGGNGGYTYSWTGPDGFTATATDLDGLAAGTYSVTVVDINGCEANGTITLAAPEPLAADLDAFTFPGGTGISCAGQNDGSITAIITGGTAEYQLSWSGPDGFVADAASIADLAAGTYCLQVTDANDCQVQQCATIVAPEPLTATTAIIDASCGEMNGSVQVVPNGGAAPYSVSWEHGATTPMIVAMAPNAYTATVTDANGCSTVVQALVNGSDAVTGMATASGNVCHDGTEGTIDLTVLSGAAPFQFQWSNGASTEDLDGLASGTYAVTVTDGNGCTFQDAWTVEAPPAIAIGVQLSSYAGGFNVSTWQGINGSIITQVSGGTAPYSYLWSNGSTLPQHHGLPAGTYVVEVTDANGCSALLTVVLTQPEDLEMPTGFSPNGDGANDSFIIRGLDAYPANTFVVVNRWGNVVYDRLNYRNDWNGENAQGQPLPDGTYFAILKVDNGQRTLQGYVDLRR